MAKVQRVSQKDRELRSSRPERDGRLAVPCMCTGCMCAGWIVGTSPAKGSTGASATCMGSRDMTMNHLLNSVDTISRCAGDAVGPALLPVGSARS